MSENKKPRRAWFQIHLSTAIVLMLVAGGLMWVNVEKYGIGGPSRQDIQRMRDTGELPLRGWPFTYSRQKVYDSSTTMEWIPLLGDIAFVLLVLTGVATVCELIVRSKKGWFQIHLSTAIVLMFVAGGLLWANMRPTSTVVEIVEPPLKLTMVECGWPKTLFTDRVMMDKPQEWRTWNFASLALNFAVALAILSAAAFACEWLIRRREARAP